MTDSTGAPLIALGRPRWPGVAAVGLLPIHALGGEAGIVVMQFVFGLVWAGLGYRQRAR